MVKKVSDAVKDYMTKNKQLNFFEDFDVDGVIIKFKKKPNKSEKNDSKEDK